MTAEPIFHLVAPRDWPTSGVYTPESLAKEGFVHFSFLDQVASSADRHYPAAPELIAVEIDPAQLGAPVVVEDSYGSGTAFPHVYSAIPVSAAIATHPLHRDSVGHWHFSRADDAPGRASSDR